MIYAELERNGHIAEKGIFLSLEEFRQYRRRGWTSTEEINAAADRICAPEDSIDAWWMKECAHVIAEHGMTRATCIMLAFHGITS